MTQRKSIAHTKAMLSEAREAVIYSYEAGDYPQGMSPEVELWVAGDGGLLNTMTLALDLLDELARLQTALQVESGTQPPGATVYGIRPHRYER